MNPSNDKLRTKEFEYSGDTNDFKFDDKERCYLCNRVLRNPKTAASIHVVNGGGVVLHPGDEAAYIPDNADCGSFSVGPECAKKLGEFAHKEAAI